MSEEFFSERLAQLRMKKGVSARDMSLSLGQSENYINMIENKKNLPSMGMFFNICEYLNVNPSQFFEEDIKNPTLMNNLNQELKKLDDSILSHFLELAKELNKKK